MTSSPEGTPSPRGLPAAIGLLTGTMAGALGLRQLIVSHPAEDAYILYRYAELWASGHGIAWYPGGPPTEGATDFLWLATLTALRTTGLDIAMSAALLNAVGAGIIGYLLARIAAQATGSTRAWLLIPALCVPFFHGAYAAYFGFSALFYGACTLLTAETARSTDLRLTRAVPWLGLLCGLIRPEGNIFAIGCVALAGYTSWKRDDLRAFMASGAGTVAAGLAYFAGRAWYFGHTFPLPLLVKGRGGLEALGSPLSEWLPNGVTGNLVWLVQPTNGPFAAAWFAVLGAVAFLAWKHTREQARWSLAGLLPAVLLFLAFMTVTQSQNVERRFQAPITLVLWATTLHLAVPLAKTRRWVAPAAAIGIALPVLAFTPSSWRALNTGTYLDSYAPWMADQMTADETLMVSEAGRMGYWPPGEVIDMLGLNTAHTAENVPTVEWYDEVNPELLMFHAADLVDTRDWDAMSEAVIELEPGDLSAHIEPRYAEEYADLPTDYEREGPMHVGSLVAISWLEANPGRYRLFVVDHHGRHGHIWAFRSDWPTTPVLIEGLHTVTSAHDWPSYRDLRTQEQHTLLPEAH